LREIPRSRLASLRLPPARSRASFRGMGKTIAFYPRNPRDEFIRRGTTQGLDTSCVGQLQRRPFLLEPTKEGIRVFE